MGRAMAVLCVAALVALLAACAPGPAFTPAPARLVLDDDQPLPACTVVSQDASAIATGDGTWSSGQVAQAITIVQTGWSADWATLGAGQRVQVPPTGVWPTSDVPSVPVRAIRIALMTAMQESSLQNLDHDDDAINPDGTIADGGGLFQQQPSKGWGSWEQVTDPRYATSRFLAALAHTPGWQNLEPWEAAHRVQTNQSATDYQHWWDDSAMLLARLIDVRGCLGF